MRWRIGAGGKAGNGMGVIGLELLMLRFSEKLCGTHFRDEEDWENHGLGRIIAPLGSCDGIIAL